MSIPTAHSTAKDHVENPGWDSCLGACGSTGQEELGLHLLASYAVDSYSFQSPAVALRRIGLVPHLNSII